jgi:hypothetical protein
MDFAGDLQDAWIENDFGSNTFAITPWRKE